MNINLQLPRTTEETDSNHEICVRNRNTNNLHNIQYDVQIEEVKITLLIRWSY